MLKSSITGETKIWVNEWDGKKYYSAPLSKKKYENGAYVDGFEYGNITLQFKGRPEFENGERINVTEGKLSFYKKNKQTVPIIVVMEFERLSATDSHGDPIDGFDALNDDVPF